LTLENAIFAQGIPVRMTLDVHPTVLAYLVDRAPCTATTRLTELALVVVAALKIDSPCRRIDSIMGPGHNKKDMEVDIFYF
jgi:hypothetical protein